MILSKRILGPYENKQVSWLVTGVAGFIGSNLAEYLLRNNQKVIGFDNFSTGYKHNIEDLLKSLENGEAGNFSFVEGDVSDLSACEKVCQNVDIVLHQAALGSVPRSIADPIATNNSNVTGFLNMLTACKNSEVRRFVYASSSSVYGDSVELPKVEERTGNLLSPYGVSKKTNELYAEIFANIYGMETVGLRYFNVYGKRQDPNGAYAAVIPKWIDAVLSGNDVFINGDGETSRDFTYIEDVVKMNILAGTSENAEIFGNIFNVAAGGRSTLNELFAIICKELSNLDPDLVIKEAKYREFRQGDIRHSNADISKAKKYMDYTASYDLKRGMENTIEYYLSKRS